MLPLFRTPRGRMRQVHAVAMVTAGFRRCEIAVVAADVCFSRDYERLGERSAAPAYAPFRQRVYSLASWRFRRVLRGVPNPSFLTSARSLFPRAKFGFSPSESAGRRGILVGDRVGPSITRRDFGVGSFLVP